MKDIKLRPLTTTRTIKNDRFERTAARIDLLRSVKVNPKSIYEERNPPRKYQLHEVLMKSI